MKKKIFINILAWIPEIRPEFAKKFWIVNRIAWILWVVEYEGGFYCSMIKIFQKVDFFFLNSGQNSCLNSGQNFPKTFKVLAESSEFCE